MLTTYAFPQKSFPSLSEEGLSVELTVVAPEQPSPVSVLDVSFYKDDLPPSPVKKSEDPFKGKVLGSVIFFKFFYSYYFTRLVQEQTEMESYQSVTIHMQGNCFTKYHYCFLTTVDTNVLFS